MNNKANQPETIQIPDWLKLGDDLPIPDDFLRDLVRFPAHLGMNEGDRPRQFFVYNPGVAPNIEFVADTFRAAELAGQISTDPSRIVTSVRQLEQLQPGDVLFFYEGHTQDITRSEACRKGLIAGAYVHPCLSGFISPGPTLRHINAWGVNTDNICPIRVRRNFGTQNYLPVLEAKAVRQTLERLYFPPTE